MSLNLKRKEQIYSYNILTIFGSSYENLIKDLEHFHIPISTINHVNMLTFAHFCADNNLIDPIESNIINNSLFEQQFNLFISNGETPVISFIKIISKLGHLKLLNMIEPLIIPEINTNLKSDISTYSPNEETIFLLHGKSYSYNSINIFLQKYIPSDECGKFISHEDVLRLNSELYNEEKRLDFLHASNKHNLNVKQSVSIRKLFPNSPTD